LPTQDEINALIRAAQEQAATEVETWIPEKPGDSIAGTVVDVGSITTIYGPYYTTTLDVATEDGNKFYRVAWMGAVMQSAFLRKRPVPGDIVAVHYQKDVSPKSGMQDYKLLESAVIDPRTGRSKVPVDLTVAEVTHDQAINANARTGEIAETADIRSEHARKVTDGPLPGEEPL